MTVRRYALLDGEDVVNVILLDVADDYEPEEGLSLRLSKYAGRGWKYVDGQWVAPPEPEEPEITEVVD